MTTTQHITLEIDGAPDFRFRGILVARVKSSADTASSCYSGQVGQWEELDLYRTAGGLHVCHRIRRSLWQGDHGNRSGLVCKSEDGIYKFFGYGWLAKYLYAEAGIDSAVDVDEKELS